MTDITRLINSIKRRTSSARELRYDVLFVPLDDLDVLADSLETALRVNAAQADHIKQLQDSFNKLAAENGALKQFPEQIVKFIGGLGTSEIGSDTKEKIELAANRIKTPITDRTVAGFKADGEESTSQPLEGGKA
ncbi:hypothetical protein [Klebsiella pneumoniae]|uniref:hypothetical protein n=1 Tax=Klebsiella pneumoniae TaxID=573 RepID=UPI0021672851|nr:hypothetical protein [Klebsiella pneumoniae]MCS4445203.1 hypothetical protein [Klebsiella pneumoniae]